MICTSFHPGSLAKAKILSFCFAALVHLPGLSSDGIDLLLRGLPRLHVQFELHLHGTLFVPPKVLLRLSLFQLPEAKGKVSQVYFIHFVLILNSAFLRLQILVPCLGLFAASVPRCLSSPASRKTFIHLDSFWLSLVSCS